MWIIIPSDYPDIWCCIFIYTPEILCTKLVPVIRLYSLTHSYVAFFYTLFSYIFVQSFSIFLYIIFPYIYRLFAYILLTDEFNLQMKLICKHKIMQTTLRWMSFFPKLLNLILKRRNVLVIPKKLPTFKYLKR